MNNYIRGQVAKSFMRYRKFLPLLCVLFFYSAAPAQEKYDKMIVLQGDLVKTDFIEPFGKMQIGGEFHYFPLRNLSASAGFETWTADEISFTAGLRWYPKEHVFIRTRALIGENDLNLGVGWAKPLSPSLRFEAIGDFYFSVDFAIRAGLSYTIRKKTP